MLKSFSSNVFLHFIYNSHNLLANKNKTKDVFLGATGDLLETHVLPDR